MVEVRTIDKIRKWFSFNRIYIINEHYNAIRDELAPASESDKSEVKYLSQEFEKYAKRTNKLANWRVFFYVVLYATLFTSFLKVIPFLNFLVNFIELSNALLGSTIAFIIIFLLTVRININIQRMQACMMHLVYFYSINKKRDSKKSFQRISRVI